MSQEIFAEKLNYYNNINNYANGCNTMFGASNGRDMDEWPSGPSACLLGGTSMVRAEPSDHGCFSSQV